MREIKFRIYDKENKVMTHPDGYVLDSSWFGVTTEHYLDDSGVADLPHSERQFALMQFTGLKDKNGKEIYEGDIFKYEKHPSYLLDSFISSFVWGNEFGCFGYNVNAEIIGELFSPLSIHDELQHDFLNHIEIIGNIYENPELIK